MENFTPWSSFAGGALIGLAGAAMLGLHGRIAGISGIFSGLLKPTAGDVAWRASFVGGLVVAGAVYAAFAPQAFHIGIVRSPGAIVLAGLLVGVGTRLGSGCTSGHGVCGISRLSRRSIAATVTFMATGAMAAAVVTQLLGGVV